MTTNVTQEPRPLLATQVEALKVEIYADRTQVAAAAALRAAASMRAEIAAHGRIAVMFATGASQLEVLKRLTANTDLEWPRVTGFHLDEYAGLNPAHPASFRHYLRSNLLARAPLGVFHEIEADRRDLDEVCRRYAAMLDADFPRLGFAGIGESGHLAFNDPHEADFEDPLFVRQVRLDPVSRMQQVAEGWFPDIASVPETAVTVTIPPILRIRELLVVAPGSRKAEIVARALTEPIHAGCPATVLRRHQGATLLLDQAAAAALPASLRPAFP